MYCPPEGTVAIEAVEALRRHDWSVAEELVKRAGGMSALSDPDGDSVLHDAAWSRDAELVSFVLERLPKSLLDAVDSEGYTALIHACQRGCAGIAKALLEAGCSVAGQLPHMESPMELAVEGRCVEVVEVLVAHGAFEAGPKSLRQEVRDRLAEMASESPRDKLIARMQRVCGFD